ncbi:hypothetical protein Tco_0713071 [Tanacetum coccineum]
MANREECLDGCDGAGGGEVIGSGVDLGVIKSSSGEIPDETIGERGGDMMGLSGGPARIRRIFLDGYGVLDVRSVFFRFLCLSSGMGAF